MPSSKLFVNLDALSGELRVEALDADGKVAGSSAPISGDHPDVEVAWEIGSIAALARTHRLDVISLIAAMTYADVMEFAAPET